MGEPIKIYDLAVKMIELSGLRAFDSDDELEGDIEIKITGLKSGEKLYEELLIGKDDEETNHPKIRMASESYLTWEEFSEAINNINKVAKSSDTNGLISLLEALVDGFQHQKKL